MDRPFLVGFIVPFYRYLTIFIRSLSVRWGFGLSPLGLGTPVGNNPGLLVKLSDDTSHFERANPGWRPDPGDKTY